MKTVPVQSSNIAGVGYDPNSRELRVEFKSGQTHDYVGVEPDAYARFMAADSHGQHFHQHIRGRYANKKAGGAPPAVVPRDDHLARLDAAARRWRGE